MEPARPSERKSRPKPRSSMTLRIPKVRMRRTPELSYPKNPDVNLPVFPSQVVTSSRPSYARGVIEYPDTSETSEDFHYSVGLAKFPMLPDKESSLLKVADDGALEIPEPERIKASVHVMVCDFKRQILVFREHEDKPRNIPGGKLDIGETFEEGFKREMKEELPAVTSQWGASVLGVIGGDFTSPPSDSLCILSFVEDFNTYSITFLSISEDLRKLGVSPSLLWSSGDAEWVKNRLAQIFEGRGKMVTWDSVKDLVWDPESDSFQVISTAWADWDTTDGLGDFIKSKTADVDPDPPKEVDSPSVTAEMG